MDAAEKKKKKKKKGAVPNGEKNRKRNKDPKLDACIAAVAVNGGALKDFTKVMKADREASTLHS